MTEAVTPETRLERAPDVLWRVALDGVLVLSPAQEEPLFISSPGDVVWSLMAVPSTVTELAAGLADLYGTDEQIVRSDLQPVLVALRKVGAIREARPGPH